MAKRYYWLKLPDGFFRQKAIKKLRKIAGGDTYTIIYLKMLLVAMKQDGRLYFEGVEATFYDELALDLDEEVENVRVTVMFLIQQDLMQLIDETEYSLSECAKMTGSESTSAARVRKYRSKEALQCNTDVTGCNEVKQICNGEIEKEKEIELDKEKDNKNISLELKDSKQNTFISLPLVKGSGNYDVTFNYLNSLRELFPALDVEQEFRSMAAWLDSHPRNRKTPRGIKRFITGWLERSQNSISVNDPACGAGATLVAAANIFHRKKINYQTRVLFTANDIDRVVAQMCYIQLSLLGCAGWVAVANTISNPVCGDPLMPVEKPGQEFWYTPFYFRGEWNCRRQIQIFKEMCGSWITPIEERNPGKITFYFDFEKGDYKCQNS